MTDFGNASHDIGVALDRGSFPAAPKDRREVKGGNVTHTFRP